MSELLNLDQLADMAGDEEGLELGKRDFKDPFALGLAYPVEIVEQKVSTTKNGYSQVALKLAILKSDGSQGPSAFRWLTLPVFSDEVKNSVDPEKITMLKGAFGDRLHGFLRAADPEIFTICRMEKIAGKWKFFDHMTGDELDKTAKTAREKKIGKAVVAMAGLINNGSKSYVGQKLFYVRTQDKNKADKFYDNFYSVQPDKYELAEV